MCRSLQRLPPLLILVLLRFWVRSLAPAMVLQRMRSSTRSPFTVCTIQRADCANPTLTNWMSRMDSHITKTLGLQRSNRTSAPSLHVCAKSRHMLHQHQIYQVRQDPGLHSNKVDGSTAAGPHGPGSSSDNRNTRRRLDISPNNDDEDARSAVLLRFQCEQYHTGITKWINILYEESNMPASGRPVTIHCKAGSCRSGLYVQHEANIKSLFLNHNMI